MHICTDALNDRDAQRIHLDYSTTCGHEENALVPTDVAGVPAGSQVIEQVIEQCWKSRVERAHHPIKFKLSHLIVDSFNFSSIFLCREIICSARLRELLSACVETLVCEDGCQRCLVAEL